MGRQPPHPPHHCRHPHSHHRTSHRPPTAEESETLNLAPGVSVLAIQRQTMDTTNRIVEAAHLILSGDRVEATFTTPRGQSAVTPRGHLSRCPAGKTKAGR
ncbi:UTRA domain-containing protein [Streptomyces sp. enrichment culture]|uniref:UTRA domain-containing protein n=1 Tax=Streptomyces sp. enrichment culture TaxID=1795815 RepID=UPI003F576C9C